MERHMRLRLADFAFTLRLNIWTIDHAAHGLGCEDDNEVMLIMCMAFSGLSYHILVSLNCEDVEYGACFLHLPATMDCNKHPATSSTTMPMSSREKANGCVQHSAILPETDARLSPTPHRSLVTRLGLWNIIVLTAGAIVSLLAMSFLALLWAGSESAKTGERTPLLWFHIVETGWATRVVTVASVLIRLATAAQMGVFAALIAAWILETTGAAAEHLPMLSIIRTVNNGPQSHIWNVFHSVRTWSKHFYSTLVVLAILDALALQFTSTLLITDFGPTAVVPGAIYDDKVLYSAHGQYDDEAGNIQAGVGVDFYQTAPSTYARFAEYAEPPHLGADYADTGATLRAFLPFESETRSVLRSYEGPATVFDARIRCTTPSISIRNITFLFGSGTNSNYEIAIAGQMKLQGTIPGIVLGKNDELSGYEGAFLHSVVARIYWANSTDWRLSFSIPLLFQDVQGFSDNVLDPGNTGSMPLLLMNSTGNGWQTLLDEVVTAGPDQSGIYPVGPFEWTQKSSGIWADLSPGNASLDVGLSATLCFANLNSNNYVVRVDDGQDFLEPKTMAWEADTKRYNTSRVRRILDRSDGSLTPKQRGILTLHPPANWTSQEMDDGGSDFLTSPIQMGLNKLLNPEINLGNPFSPGAFWGATAAMTPFSDYNGVHRTHAALFQDIIQNTGNPALAFQAFFTVLSQMTYYDLLPQFDIASNASYSASEKVDVPTQWTGFIVVMVLLAIHAGLVMTAVILFLIQTNHSLLGNAWQAVAQVLSSDTMDTLHSASYMTDLEVKRLLRVNRYEDNEVVLRAGADGGRSQAVYRKGTGGSC